MEETLLLHNLHKMHTFTMYELLILCDRRVFAALSSDTQGVFVVMSGLLFCRKMRTAIMCIKSAFRKWLLVFVIV